MNQMLVLLLSILVLHIRTENTVNVPLQPHTRSIANAAKTSPA